MKERVVLGLQKKNKGDFFGVLVYIYKCKGRKKEERKNKGK